MQMRERPRLWQLAAFVAVLTISTYLLIEALYSLLFVNRIIYPPTGGWFFENSGRTIHFCPVRGYKLTTSPSRMGRVAKGQIEHLGVLRGNSQGFPDEDDFAAARSDPSVKRIAVFGDSFSSSQFLLQNWPDAVERLAGRSGAPIQLLNFSVDGGGLANWWSILTKIVQEQNYEIDGLIFAVFRNDLYRSFAISDDRGYSRHMFAYVKSWNPDDWPKNLAQAKAILKPTDGYVVSQEQFPKALSGDWHPEERPLGFYFSVLLMNKARELFFGQGDRTKRKGSPLFNSQQEAMIADIAAFARSNSLPVIVIHVPCRPCLLTKRPVPDSTHQFAQRLNATFIDGSRAFAGLSNHQIRSHWHPYDGHWNQTGSDRFARFAYRAIQQIMFEGQQ